MHHNSQINRPSSLYARFTLMWTFLQNSRPVSKITAKKIPTPPAIEGIGGHLKLKMSPATKKTAKSISKIVL